MDTPGIWPKPTPASECLALTFAPAVPTSDPADPETGCPGPPPASATAACPSCPCAHDPGAYKAALCRPITATNQDLLHAEPSCVTLPASRSVSHPDCRPVLILIVAPQKTPFLSYHLKRVLT